MTKPIFTLLVLAAFSTGCAGLIQTASITEAYKEYDRQEYERTLELLHRAENAQPTTREMKAELAYLKARAHEGLGETDVAMTLYQYLAEEHRDSQYGYLASQKIGAAL